MPQAYELVVCAACRHEGTPRPKHSRHHFLPCTRCGSSEREVFALVALDLEQLATLMLLVAAEPESLHQVRLLDLLHAELLVGGPLIENAASR